MFKQYDLDQTARAYIQLTNPDAYKNKRKRMHRLKCVFAGRTCHIGSVMSRPSYSFKNLKLLLKEFHFLMPLKK